MATRKKLTPFARLFLVIIIVLPLAYGGASYLKGEDPIANVKEMLGGQSANSNSNSNSSSTSSRSTYSPQDEIKDLKRENKELRQQVQELKDQLNKQSSDSGTRQKWGN